VLVEDAESVADALLLGDKEGDALSVGLEDADRDVLNDDEDEAVGDGTAVSVDDELDDIV